VALTFTAEDGNKGCAALEGGWEVGNDAVDVSQVFGRPGAVPTATPADVKGIVVAGLAIDKVKPPGSEDTCTDAEG
jgi:hypothetical protein